MIAWSRTGPERPMCVNWGVYDKFLSYSCFFLIMLYFLPFLSSSKLFPFSCLSSSLLIPKADYCRPGQTGHTTIFFVQWFASFAWIGSPKKGLQNAAKISDLSSDKHCGFMWEQEAHLDTITSLTIQAYQLPIALLIVQPTSHNPPSFNLALLLLFAASEWRYVVEKSANESCISVWRSENPCNSFFLGCGWHPLSRAMSFIAVESIRRRWSSTTALWRVNLTTRSGLCLSAKSTMWTSPNLF